MSVMARLGVGIMWIYKIKMKKTQLCLGLFVAVALLLTGGVSTVLASSTNGVIDPIDKYAWSENAGWITFGEPDGNVHVTDSLLSGSAWSANFGWIVLNPAAAGVMNNGEGVLSGQAWGENTGWVDFSGVTIDANGYFLGQANGVTTGQISFNCLNSLSCGSSDFKVRTDWRPRSARPVCNNALDDDGDGLVDYPADLGCTSISDPNETDASSGGTSGGSGAVNFPTVPVVDPDGLHFIAEQGDVPQCQNDFDDITGHWGSRYIDELYCLGIVSGRAPNQFVPDDGATRAEITKMALLMNGFQLNETDRPTFPDMDDRHWAYHLIGTAELKKVVSGFGDGLFRPDNKVTRAELVKIFLLAAGHRLPDKLSYSFSDVPTYAWYYGYVSYAFGLDLINGYADGSFKPDQQVSRAEAAKIAVYMLHM